MLRADQVEGIVEDDVRTLVDQDADPRWADIGFDDPDLVSRVGDEVDLIPGLFRDLLSQDKLSAVDKWKESVEKRDQQEEDEISLCDLLQVIENTQMPSRPHRTIKRTLHKNSRHKI